MVLKELTPPHNVDLNFLRQCIQYIITKKDTATTTELDIFLQIIQTDMCNYNSIQGIYSRLEQELPCYYFEVSGVFCEKLGWAVAPYILEYNYQRANYNKLTTSGFFAGNSAITSLSTRL